jgi:hypothetical protein
MEKNSSKQWSHYIFRTLQSTNFIKYWGTATPAKLIQNDCIEGWQHAHSYIKCEN